SPTDTRTATETRTATPTRTPVDTRTASPTPSPAVTSTPGLFTLSLVVLDQQGNVVANLAPLHSGVPVTSLGLDTPSFSATNHFSPEQDRYLYVVGDNSPAVFTKFNGVGPAGVLPNGYYQVQAQLSNGSLVDLPFYLEHKNWNGGTVQVASSIHGSQAAVHWSYGEAVSVNVLFYDLAGELVWRDNGAGITGTLPWGLKSSSGRAVSDGIYLVKVDVSSLDGSVEDVHMLKLAVIR
ncbi:MAG TPA: hypothetical protein VNZ54_09115, partial [bacterium]|nr:hypothetical protein [bacterium]